MAEDTRKLLKLFGVAVTDAEAEAEKLGTLAARLPGASREEVAALLRDASDLFRELNARWMEVTQRVFEIQGRLQEQLSQGAFDPGKNGKAFDCDFVAGRLVDDLDAVSRARGRRELDWPGVEAGAVLQRVELRQGDAFYRRGVLLGVREAEAPGPGKTAWTTVKVLPLTKKEMAHAAARAFRYPKTLLTCDPAVAVAYLGASHGRKRLALHPRRPRSSSKNEV